VIRSDAFRGCRQVPCNLSIRRQPQDLRPRRDRFAWSAIKSSFYFNDYLVILLSNSLKVARSSTKSPVGSIRLTIAANPGQQAIPSPSVWRRPQHPARAEGGTGTARSWLQPVRRCAPRRPRAGFRARRRGQDPQ